MKLETNIQDIVYESLKVKRSILIIENDNSFGDIIIKSLNSLDVKFKINLMRKEISLSNGSNFKFIKHSFDSMNSIMGYEFHYVFVNEEVSKPNFRSYKNRERLLRHEN